MYNMIDLPDLHDGYFDGLWISGNDSAHLFFRTEECLRLTLVLREVEAMYVSSLCAGNIILDVVVVPTAKLTSEMISDVHQLSPSESDLAEKLLVKAQQKGLTLLEFTSSYGAEGSFLFRSAELLLKHCLSD